MRMHADFHIEALITFCLILEATPPFLTTL